MRHAGWTAMVVSLAWALAACSGSGGSPEPAPTTLPLPPTTTTIQPTNSSTNQAELDSLIELVMSYTTTPGAVVSVSVPGHASWTRGYGFSDPSSGALMDPNGQFRIGDVTSMFTCTLLYKLAQDEQVSVDEPASLYVEGGPESTLAELCRSATGIPDYWDNPNFYQRVAEDPTRSWSPGALVSYASSAYPAGPRGTWSPSATNTVLVGMAIETVTQKPLRESMQEWILGPMRLESTSFPTASDVAISHPASNGWWQPEPASPLVDYSALSPSVGAGSGAMVSSVADLGRFVASVGEELHVGRELTARMQESVPMGPDLPEWMRYAAGHIEMGPLVAAAGSIPGYAVGTIFDTGSGSNFTVVFNNSTGGGLYPLFLAAVAASILLPDSDRLPFTMEEAFYYATPPERR